MTFDDDFLQINFQGGVRRVRCQAAGIEWPPPERITYQGFTLERVRYSQIPDDVRAGLTYLIRGAEYNIVAEG